MKTCTVDNCDRAHRARGLCASHYNQTHQPNRHAKKIVNCAWCDKEVLKTSGGNKTRKPVCSNECRQWLTTPYCALPKDHPARSQRKVKLDLPTFISNECNECGTPFVEKYRTTPSQHCSAKCKGRVKARARKAREHRATGTFRWIDVIRIWVASGKRCSYCDFTMTGQPDPDHVIALSRGGRNDLGNIVPCCQLCNADKSDLTLAEWAEDRARLGKPALRYELPHTDPRFKHLTLGVATRTAWRHRNLALAA